ncbi:signal peptidase II [Anaerofustis butyriciformans]|uniref:signal peptidase II n=1 Tax=Anaerofustis butyriciformans TaxID=3108533 RepID=UPI002E2F2274|nr:signal peptidase II [Anaerofustis sp. HA2171]
MIYYLIVILCIIIDQISKYIVINNLKPIGSIPIIKNVFHLTYCENTGAAFSMFSKNTAVLTAVSLVFIFLVFFFLLKSIKKGKTSKIMSFGLAFILGGAIGNFIDRFFHGFVTDFFDFRLINFAIFNVADIFITIGAILFCIYVIFTKDEKIF